MISVSRYFKTIKHPLGEGIYLKITLDLYNQDDVDKFLNTEIEWDEDVEVEEVSKEEYDRETDDCLHIDIK